MGDKKIERVSKTWTVRKDLADRVTSEAEDRMISPSLILEKALDAYLDKLPPVTLDLAPDEPAPTAKASPVT